MDVIQKVIQPERLYILRFGEEVEALHFHLFPRTPAMAELYARLHPAQPPFSGAQLFDWIRLPQTLALLSFPVTSAQALPLLRQEWSARGPL